MKINKTLKINDLCDILNGYAFKSDKYVSEGIRVIRITNVQKGFVEDTSPAFYPNSEENKIKDYLLYENDLLVSLTGNVGRVALLEKQYLPAALNQRVACLRIKDQNLIHIKYLFTYLNSEKFENDCIFSAKGIAQKNMSTEWLKHYEIPVPEMNKQIEIYSNLEKVSEIINNHKALLSKYDILIKSRFIEMFGDPVTNPMGWEVKKLGDTGSCKNGMNFHYDENGFELNCLGVGDFKDYSIINECEKLPIVSLNELPSDEYLLKNEDLVFVRSNGNKDLVGRCVAVYPNDLETTFSGFCIRFRQTNNTFITEYLLRTLKTESMRKRMAGRGANIQNLNQQILTNLDVPVPPLALQQQFATFVQQIDKSKFEYDFEEDAA